MEIELWSWDYNNKDSFKVPIPEIEKKAGGQFVGFSGIDQGHLRFWMYGLAFVKIGIRGIN